MSHTMGTACASLAPDVVNHNSRNTLLGKEPCGAVVKLQYCSPNSAHNLASIPGSQLKVYLVSHPSKVGKLSTQLAGEGGHVQPA